MSRLSTKQRRARRRRRENQEAWLGWRLMTSGDIYERVKEFAWFSTRLAQFCISGRP